MKKIVITLTIGSVSLFACNSANDKSVTTSEITTDSSTMTAAPMITDAPVQMQSADSSILAAPISSVATPVQPGASTATGLNPAHGEPGHRCDIAVGAPLNSPPSASATTQPAAPAPGNIVTAPATTNAPPATAPVVTAPGTNPPHGQPGHDCKIAVGAPLK